MVCDKITINRDNGETVEELQAAAPIIISASRSTDIPAFYADWFFDRLSKGYSAWTNPFNSKKSYVSYKKTRFIVFWSKNPEPLLKHLDKLRDFNGGINSYIQYTLNNYEKEQLEKGVPKLETRIDTFKRLVDKLDFGSVVWRFDPLILTDKISINDLLNKIQHIGDQLKGYTEKLVFSYADVIAYKKVKANLERNNINYKEFTEPQMEYFAKELSSINQKWKYQLATCGEKIDIDKYGITHNRCIDDDLMIKIAHNDKILMDYLCPIDLFGVVPQKDKGQRKFCGCIASKDIGEYNTCPHLCEYCYANKSQKEAVNNYKQHLLNPNSETISGK